MRNVVALLEGQNRTLISAVTDARTIDRRPYNEWLFEQDKKLDVVDSFVTLEIRSLLELVVILVLS